MVPRVLSESYQRAATATGDEVEIVDVEGDHMAVLDPKTPMWDAVVAAIAAAA